MRYVFVKWVGKKGKIALNPGASCAKMALMRQKQTERRAFVDELAAAGGGVRPRRWFIWTAAFRHPAR